MTPNSDFQFMFKESGNSMTTAKLQSARLLPHWRPSKTDDNYELLRLLRLPIVRAEGGGLSTCIARSTQRVNVGNCMTGIFYVCSHF